MKSNQIVKLGKSINWILPLLLALILFVCLHPSDVKASGLNPVDPSGTNLHDWSGSGVYDNLLTILEYLLGFTAIGAIGFIVIGGYQYMSSGANEEMAEKGKRTVRSAIIGLVIILISLSIVNFLIRILAT